MLSTRRGHTLLELLVSIVVGAIVLSAAATVGLGQTRAHRRVRTSVTAAGIRRDAADVVPALLQSLSASAGDIPPNGARDTTLDFREVVFTGVGCSDGASKWLLYEADDGGLAVASGAASTIGAADSLWSLAADDTAQVWRAAEISAVSSSGAACAADSLGARPLVPSGVTIGAIAMPGSAGLVPIRVTRRARLSVYRASDGSWYLGLREWSASLGRLDVVQPVAGPFAPSSARRPAFIYRDGSGVSLGSAAATRPADIATVEVSLAPAVDPLDSSVVRAAQGADRVVVSLEHR